MLGQRKAADCETLLNAVSRGNIEAIVTHFSIHAVEAVLGSGEPLLKFLRNIENSVALSVFETGVAEELSAAMLTKKESLDFDDAIQYFVAKRLGVESIVSYDKHFDKLDVPRTEPSQLIGKLSKLRPFPRNEHERFDSRPHKN
jgi:predicted nucleic acid-binding protein